MQKEDAMSAALALIQRVALELIMDGRMEVAFLAPCPGPLANLLGPWLALGEQGGLQTASAPQRLLHFLDFDAQNQSRASPSQPPGRSSLPSGSRLCGHGGCRRQASLASREGPECGPFPILGLPGHATVDTTHIHWPFVPELVCHIGSVSSDIAGAGHGGH